ncbi:DNA-binding NtrC family response regulator [Paraburkholderia youngii]
MPPLRERRADIAPLARHLLERSALQYGLSAAALGRVLAFLDPLFANYAWPGNVRELENLLARAAIYIGDGTSEMSGNSTADALPDWLAVFPEFGRIRLSGDERITEASQAASPGSTAPRASPSREDALRALEQSGGNRAAASRALGIGRTTLWRLLKG